MGFEPAITIEEVIQGIQQNRYVLPAIQREFVWSAKQVKELFDSLLRGYPIGSFLFWRIDPNRVRDYQYYRFMDRYHERDYRHNEPVALLGDREVVAVLDGQQRLTALNIGLKGFYADKLPYYRWHNNAAFLKRFLYLSLTEPSTEDEAPYCFELLQEKDALNGRTGVQWFKVQDILGLKQMGDVVNYCIREGLTENRSTYASNTLTRLWQVVKADNLVSAFAERDQDLDKVLQIFIRVNSGGTKLDPSDMLLSIATAQWKEIDAREAITDLVEELNREGDGFGFNKDFVLKACLYLTDLPGIEFRITNFTAATMALIETKWETIRAALQLMASLLSSWGYSGQTLVSKNAAIPIAYHIQNIGNPKNFVTHNDFATDRATMRLWLESALLKRAFSGQSDSVLRTIRRVQQTNAGRYPASAIAEALPAGKSMRFGPEDLNGVLGLQYGDSYTFTALAVLYPWLKYDQVFHLDHIFPKALFTKKRLRQFGIPEERWGEWLDHVNDFANLQLLQGHKNMSKQDEEFERWLSGECPQPKDLAHYKEMHMIPDVSLRFEDFPQFLAARESLLRGNLESALRLPDDPMSGK